MSNSSSHHGINASAEQRGQGSVVVYTAVTSRYDLVLPPARQSAPLVFGLFDDAGTEVRGWQRVPFRRSFDCDITTNRFHKFFAHELFPDAEYSIYLDGNIGVVGDLVPLLDEFIASKCAMGLFRHRDRSTVGEELSACLRMSKFDAADLQLYKKQIQHYRAERMPENQPLNDNGVLFRWHSHPMLATAMDQWWEQFLAFTKRDQISLPYVLWKTSLPINRWQWSVRSANSYLEKYPHRKHLMRDIRTRVKNALTKHRVRRQTRCKQLTPPTVTEVSNPDFQ